MDHMTPVTDSPAETPWLDQDQQHVWRSFLGGVTVLMDQLDRDLRTQHGLSMAEYEILVRLSEAPNRSIRMAELAAAVAHSRSRVTHTIARLERDGIVTRGQCSTDGLEVLGRRLAHEVGVDAAHVGVGRLLQDAEAVIGERGVSATLTDHGFGVLEQAAHTHVSGVHAHFVSQASS
ncbi:MAG: MarR family transcriptional regulator, partial [Actinomycetales bacterium]